MFGIYDLNTCSSLNYKERLEIYKKCGFKEIALYIDSSYQTNNENYIEIINYAKKINLSINQAHLDWKISNLICDETTNKYFDYISQKLQEASSLGIKYIIAHASQSDNPPIINKAQLEKFKNLMKTQTNNTTLCLENVKNNNNLDSILSLNLPNVKVCFDLGHAHCYGDEDKLFEKYKNKIICSHLHNNFGKDTHNLLTNGEINYFPFLQKLSSINNSSNCLECFPPFNTNLNKEEFTNFVKDCYNSINETN